MPDRRNRIDGRRREAPGRRAAVLPFLAAVCLLALAPAGLLAPAAEARPASPEAGVTDTTGTAGAPSLILEVPAYLPVEPPGEGERRNRRVELTDGIRLARVEAQGQELRELTAEELRRLRPGEGRD